MIMTINYGYTQSVVTATQLLQLKSTPVPLVTSIDATSIIVPHKIVIRTIAAQTAYNNNNADLRIKVGSVVFLSLPKKDFLDTASSLIIMNNCADCPITLTSLLQGQPLMLVNDGSNDLTVGNYLLEINTYYSQFTIN